MRLATTTSSSGGSSASARGAAARASTSTVCSSASTCTCSERMPGVTLDDAAKSRVSANHAAERVRAEPQVEVEDHRPVLDEHRARRPARRYVTCGASPSRRGSPGRSTPGRRSAGARGASPSRAAARRDRRPAPRRDRRARSARGRPARAGRASTGRRAIDRDRAHEPAEARTVGAEEDRHVAGEVDRADGVRRVVDVRRVEPRLTAVGARPLDGSGRPAARRCATSCSAPSSRWRRRRVDAGLGEEVGRGVRAVDDRELPRRA